MLICFATFEDDNWVELYSGLCMRSTSMSADNRLAGVKTCKRSGSWSAVIDTDYSSKLTQKLPELEAWYTIPLQCKFCKRKYVMHSQSLTERNH